MKSLLALLVLAAFACSVVEMKKGPPKPWEVRNQIRQLIGNMKEAVEDIADDECLERPFGPAYMMKPSLVKKMKKLLSQLKKARKDFQCTRMEKEKRRPPMDTDPCKQHIRLGFNETMNENGTMVWEAKVIANSSVQKCDASMSWISLHNMKTNKTASAEFLLRQCPPAAGCGEKLLRFNTTDLLPGRNETRNVTFNMEFEGECAAFNDRNNTVEVKVCPNGRKLFRLPMKCQHGKLCELKKALEGEGWGEGEVTDEEGDGPEGPEGPEESSQSPPPGQ